MREWERKAKTQQSEEYNNEQNKVEMGHRSVPEMADPGRHPFIPAPFSLHCYSSGSVTVAERKILAGWPVKHEQC